MTKHASGTFEVRMNPQAEDNVGDQTVGRMSLDKQFHGDLDATSKGQMLAVSSDVPGSAGYVAMERVNGTLHGRKGTFALQHSGTMTRGMPQLSITVVSDSGSGELVGLAGKMTINIVDGKHYYEDYRVVDGIKVPFVLRSEGPVRLITRLTEIKHNVPIEDARFKSPPAN